MRERETERKTRWGGMRESALALSPALFALSLFAWLGSVCSILMRRSAEGDGKHASAQHAVGLWPEERRRAGHAALGTTALLNTAPQITELDTEARPPTIRGPPAGDFHF